MSAWVGRSSAPATRPGPSAAGRAVVVVVANLACFSVLHRPFRLVERTAAAGMVALAGGGHRIQAVLNTGILVRPYRGAGFTAIITPSCSALASVLAIGILSSLTPRFSRTRRAAATAVAMGTVAAGNVVRIAASIGVGLVAGRASLILFHDWVGGLLTLVYTLGGYILLLFILLSPPDRVGERLEENGLAP